MQNSISIPKTVLVVDSQVAKNNPFIWQLPPNEYSLTVATDVAEALDLVSSRDYDLALIEVDLPKRNSFNLLRKLRREHPMTKVVMFTDYGDEELWVDVVNEGASDLITRPLERVDLSRQF